MVAKQDDMIGNRVGLNEHQRPAQLFEDLIPIGTRQRDDDHSGVDWMEQWNGVEKILVRGEEYGFLLLRFRKQPIVAQAGVGIIIEFTEGMAKFLQQFLASAGKVLVGKKLHLPTGL